MSSRTLLWSTIALLVGALTWFGLRLYGSGPLRAEAVSVALIAAAFAWALKYVRLVAPTDRRSQSRALLTKRSKPILLSLFGLSTVGCAALAVMQAVQGYTPIEAQAVIDAAEAPKPGFYAARGTPQLEALYTLGGRDGERFLVPLDTYEGRLLIIVDDSPPATPIKVTGRLQHELRTVQTSSKGDTEGPFLPLYREHMRLTENTAVYFLDTGVRAGLNLPAVLLVLVPAYLFLLVLGAPVRRRGRGMRVAPAPDRLNPRPTRRRR